MAKSKTNRFIPARRFIEQSASELKNPQAVAVWMILWLHSNAEGLVTLSQVRLGKMLGVSSRTARNHVATLRDHGLIKTVKAGGNLNGNVPNTYQLCSLTNKIRESLRDNS